MQALSEEELVNVSGGGIKIGMGVAIIIGSIITFVIGAINGFLTTTKTCKK